LWAAAALLAGYFKPEGIQLVCWREKAVGNAGVPAAPALGGLFLPVSQ